MVLEGLAVPEDQEVQVDLQHRNQAYLQSQRPQQDIHQAIPGDQVGQGGQAVLVDLVDLVGLKSRCENQRKAQALLVDQEV